MLHKFYGIILAVIFFMMNMASVSAATLTANVEPQQVPYGEALTLQLIYDGDDGNLLQPDLSVLQQDFTIYSTASSLQSSFINGVSKQTRQWQIGLMPKKSGIINIPEITVGQYKTQPLQVEVLASGTSKPQKINSSNDYHQASDMAQKADFAAYINVENKTPYVQQQINVVLTIEDNRGLQFTSEPAFVNDDNWIIKVLQQPTVEERQGKRVIKFYYAMFPQKSGTLEVPSMQIEGYYMTYEGGDELQPIGGFFHLFDMDINNIFGVRKPVLLHTEPQILQVKPVPAEYKNQWLPATALSATAKWSDNKPVFKVGETVAREITITAAGVADTQLPDIQFTENSTWKQYPENPQLTSVVHEDEIIAQEVIRIVYIPQQGGEQILPEIRIPWYDVNAQKEKTAVIPAEKIMIEGQAVSQHITPQPQVQANSNTVKSAQLPDKVLSTAEKNDNKWQYAALFVAFAAGIAVSLLFKRTKSQQVNKQPQLILTEIIKNLHAKDYRNLQNSLLQWGKTAYASETVNNLHDLAQVVNLPQFTEQMEKLNAILYADKKDDLNEKIISECIKNHKSSTKNKKQVPPLPNLYK